MASCLLRLRDKPELPSGYPCRSPQTPLPAPVGVHDVDRVAAVAVTDEGDLLPVGGPARIAVVRQVERQIPLTAPVGVHEVDLRVAIAFAGEGDLPPVGRPGWR